jgi:hypothetical protein
VLTPTTAGWTNGDPRFLLWDRTWTASAYGIAPPVMVNGVAGSYGSYQAPGVTSKSIYDYTQYNLNEANFGSLHSGNYNLELEQQVTDKLFVSAGWFRQDIDSSENYLLSQLQGNTIQVDTNSKLMNGQPNPYAGQSRLHPASRLDEMARPPPAARPAFGTGHQAESGTLAPRLHRW